MPSETVHLAISPPDSSAAEIVLPHSFPPPGSSLQDVETRRCDTLAPMFETIAWTDEGVVMLDQRRLPAEESYLTLRTPEEVAEAIRSMAIRGAPAIGVAAAMGLALGAKGLAESGGTVPGQRFVELC